MQIAHFYNMVIIGQGKRDVKKNRGRHLAAESYKTDFEMVKKCLVLLISCDLCYTDSMNEETKTICENRLRLRYLTHIMDKIVR